MSVKARPIIHRFQYCPKVKRTHYITQAHKKHNGATNSQKKVEVL